MSIKIMTWVFEESPTEGAERLVLLSLADNANDEGYCWPSLATIARKSGIDRRSTIRLIKKLESKQLLQVERRWNPDRLINDTNRYRILWKVVRGGDSRSLGSDSRSLGSDTESLGVVTHGHQGSDTESLGVVTESHPNLNLNHHINHQLNHQVTTTTTTAPIVTSGEPGQPLVVVDWQQAKDELRKMGIWEKVLPDYMTLAMTYGWTEVGLIHLARQLQEKYTHDRACVLLKFRIENSTPIVVSGYTQSPQPAIPDDWSPLSEDLVGLLLQFGLSDSQIDAIEEINQVQRWTEDELKQLADECSSPSVLVAYLQNNPRGK